MSAKPANPYVGARSFKYGERLYGRDREIARLRDLLISERVVLLYSPSGAGKTSLINAGLRPALETAHFNVLPVARVNEPLPDGLGHAANRYVLSMLRSLDQGLAHEYQLPPDRLAGLSLADYLDARLGGDALEGGEHVLVLDQFEEILTVDPVDRPQKEGYFDQLGKALDRFRSRLWLLLAMREEHLAGLDPLCALVPGSLKVRFRLDLLGVEQAARGIRLPAQDAGIPFDDLAVESLADDLRRVLVQQPDGRFIEKKGEYVEPVHLQVVCARIWDRLPNDCTAITPADVQTEGDVDSALAGYFSERVERVAAETGSSERSIRDWIEDKLITPQGIRGQVLKSADATEGLDNDTLDRLVNTYLLRAEPRRGATWIELAHDRLIAPIRSSNASWREAHLQPWQRDAEYWGRSERRPDLLLRGEALTRAEAWKQEHAAEMAPRDLEFVAESRKAEKAVRAQLRLRRMIRGLSAAIVALVFLVILPYSYKLTKEVRPWGALVNLSEGRVHALAGDMIVAGRLLDTFRPQIALEPSVVSRTHLIVRRDFDAIDVRTLNGTTVNDRFLRYGEVGKLRDGDLLVLANIAPFQFRAFEYPWWRPWAPTPIEGLSIPPQSWGVLIDGRTRHVRYLEEDEYYLGAAGDGAVTASTTPDEASRVLVQAGMDSQGVTQIQIEDLPDAHKLWAVVKLGETYSYAACRLAPGSRVTEIAVDDPRYASRRCEYDMRDDHEEALRLEQRLENAIFRYEDGVAFRIVPRLESLEAEAEQ